MPEEKDRESQKGEDEEFEPLEEFFAPIEDVDWPEDAEGRPRPPRAGEGQSSLGDSLEDDILPTGIPDDPLAGVDLGEELTGAPEATSELPVGDFEELRLDVGQAPEASRPAGGHRHPARAPVPRRSG